MTISFVLSYFAVILRRYVERAEESRQLHFLSEYQLPLSPDIYLIELVRRARTLISLKIG